MRESTRFSLASEHGGVLARLRRDHKRSLACVELLEQQFRGSGSAPPNTALTPILVEQIIDSPDDFHHILERRLFRRLWYRLDTFLPRYIDLDEMHDERRQRRIDVIPFLDGDEAALSSDVYALKALSAFCACVRFQTKLEERCFFPLLERHLTSDDWALVSEESEAYAAAWLSVRGSAEGKALVT